MQNEKNCVFDGVMSTRRARARVRYGHLHFVLQLQNGYRYLHNLYSFEKYLLLSKKWRIERRIPFIKIISKNPMEKKSYYHVILLSLIHI